MGICGSAQRQVLVALIRNEVFRKKSWSPTGGSRAPIESSAGVCRATEIHLSMGRFMERITFEWDSKCDVT